MGSEAAASLAWITMGNARTEVALIERVGAFEPDGLESSILSRLEKVGSVLLRGFDVTTEDRFRQFATRLSSNLIADSREHERVTADGLIQTPVAYSASRKLLWHNENSFNDSWPLRLFFACLVAPESGGQTPVADSLAVLRSLPRTLVDEFVRRGVRYERSYHEGVGLDWRVVFGTEDRREVEDRCIAEGVDLTWTDGGVHTSAVRPAVIRHPITGEPSWFNQAQHWHTACLDPATREALVELFGEDAMPRNCRFGDGGVISDDAMHSILDVYADVEFAFDWEVGDLLVVDNVRTAHARNPYAGERYLLVAMANRHRYIDPPFGAADLDDLVLEGE